jgi:hypothetical protein
MSNNIKSSLGQIPTEDDRKSASIDRIKDPYNFQDAMIDHEEMHQVKMDNIAVKALLAAIDALPKTSDCDAARKLLAGALPACRIQAQSKHVVTLFQLAHKHYLLTRQSSSMTNMRVMFDAIASLREVLVDLPDDSFVTIREHASGFEKTVAIRDKEHAIRALPSLLQAGVTQEFIDMYLLF